MPRIEATEVAPGVYLPLVVVTMNMNGQTVSELGLVDSGADTTLIPATWADACGVPYANLPGAEQQGRGAGGGYKYKIGQGELIYNAKVFSASFHVAEPACQVPGPVLGRDDFFKKYVVRFAWHRNPPDFNLDPVK